jgi:hypothetical protein
MQTGSSMFEKLLLSEISTSAEGNAFGRPIRRSNKHCTFISIKRLPPRGLLLLLKKFWMSGPDRLAVRPTRQAANSTDREELPRKFAPASGAGNISYLR